MSSFFFRIQVAGAPGSAAVGGVGAKPGCTVRDGVIGGS